MSPLFALQKRFLSYYQKLFSINEIEQSVRLQFFYWIALGLCIFDLSGFSFRAQLPSEGGRRCWSFFQNCQDFFPFQGLPHSYSYTLWMGALLGIILYAGFSAWQKKWTRAHFLLALVMLWKFSFHFILVNTGNQNFEMFMQFPTLYFLFGRAKLAGIRLVWVACLFWAAQEKFHESWITGSYFSTLELGIPLIPKGWEAWITNGVIIFEIFFAFGLISKKPTIRKFSFFSWTAFHLYSVSLVGFYYPVRCLGILWAAFYEPFQKEKTFNYFDFARPKRMVLAFILIFCLNLIPVFIPGDEKFTFEGHSFGFFMFDANHQCYSQIEFKDSEGNVLLKKERNAARSMSRCDPWIILADIRNLCTKFPKAQASWTLDHSMNGNPFYRIVDTSDACSLDYKPFSRNTWIKDVTDHPPLVGYPFTNSVLESNETPREPMSNIPQIVKSASQQWFEKYQNIFMGIYYILWLLVLVHFFYHFFKRSQSDKMTS